MLSAIYAKTVSPKELRERRSAVLSVTYKVTLLAGHSG
jgi:hypothetical protein